LGVGKPPVLGVRRNQAKIENRLVNKGKNTCEKKSRETVRKCDFENFKSCASAISPHRQPLFTTYKSAATSSLTLRHCYARRHYDTAGNQQNGEKHKAHGVIFAKVLDGRKQPIRGLWIRGTRYYARLNVENPLTGINHV
jgi:hypothetical protein